MHYDKFPFALFNSFMVWELHRYFGDAKPEFGFLNGKQNKTPNSWTTVWQIDLNKMIIVWGYDWVVCFQWCVRVCFEHPVEYGIHVSCSKINSLVFFVLNLQQF